MLKKTLNTKKKSQNYIKKKLEIEKKNKGIRKLTEYFKRKEY